MNQETQPQVHEVCIGDLLRDPAFQMRKHRKHGPRIDAATVSRYVQAYKSEEVLPPITVALVDGVAIVVDGWHRIAALESLGRNCVAATVTPMTRSDALWAAATANLKHGLPLKPADLRQVFRTLIRAGKHLKGIGRLRSFREIASLMGGQVSHVTVRNWMQADFPRTAADYSADGKGVGLVEMRHVNPQLEFRKVAERSLKDALAASRGIVDPEQRGSLLALAREVVAAIEGGGQWELPVMNTDF